MTPNNASENYNFEKLVSIKIKMADRYLKKRLKKNLRLDQANEIIEDDGWL